VYVVVNCGGDGISRYGLRLKSPPSFKFCASLNVAKLKIITVSGTLDGSRIVNGGLHSSLLRISHECAKYARSRLSLC
jgi:hypothetical protein